MKKFPHRVCLLETVFFDGNVLKETMQYLSSKGWALYKINEMMSPEGVFIKLILDQESGDTLKLLEEND